MPSQDKTTLKTYFPSGVAITRLHLIDVIDSYPTIVDPTVVDNFVAFSDIAGEQKDSGKKAADFASAAQGVTGGNAHDHTGGGGAQINHTTLSNIGTHTHANIDTHINLDDPDSPPTAGDNASIALSYTGDDVTGIDKLISGVHYIAALAYTYDGFGNLTQLQKTISGLVYTKTLTWVAGKLTAVSAWS